MKKSIAWILTVIMMLALLTGCGSKSAKSDTEYVKKNGKLIVGITDYEPMDYKDENGEWTGFDAEFARMFAKELGVDCEFFVIADWGQKFFELDSKNIDAIWNGMTITDEVTLNTNCSNPYVVNAQVVIMKADVVGNYTSTDSLKDLTFAVESGSAGEDAVKDLGITDADLANQYQYTKDVVTDSNGNLKGVSWQGCPGVLIYNREAAKVLGTDDPAEVQKSVSDWDTFTATAEKMKAAGYNMVSSVNDTYRVYSNNVSSKWVQDGKIVIDDNLMKWVDDSKKMVDAKETGTFDLWSDDWSKGFYPDGKVFCYFGPAWLINFSMAADTDGSIANQGGWGATEGPQGFFWGGTWICGATGTDNASLVKDIILKMTTDEDIMKEIVVADDDFVNNKPAMEAMAADTSYQSKVLGGQNPLAMFCAGAEKIDLSNLSAYDQGCNEEFQHAMKNYFDGKASLDDALDLFYKGVEEKYPELTH